MDTIAMLSGVNAKLEVAFIDLPSKISNNGSINRAIKTCGYLALAIKHDEEVVETTKVAAQ